MHRDETGRRRVLLKLSGEVLVAAKLVFRPRSCAASLSRSPQPLAKLDLHRDWWRRNFFRGAELSQAGMDRSRADYMGMLGTVMNSRLLQDFLETGGY